MRYWLTFTILLILNGVIWVYFSAQRPVIEEDRIEAQGPRYIDELPFEVVRPETVRLLSEKVFSNEGCLLVGPFSEEIVVDEVGTIANQEMNLKLKKVSESQQKVLNYRVFIGPLNAERGAQVAERLKGIGIEDFFFYEDESDKDSGEKYMSVGIFGYETSASMYAEELRKNNFKAQVKRETSNIDRRFWLFSSTKELAGILNLGEMERFFATEISKYKNAASVKVEIMPNCFI